MRVITRPHSAGEVPLAAFLAGIAILAALGARMFVALPDRLFTLPILCPFRAMTGLPCFACGGTRALAALARGAWSQALAFNPLVSLAALVVTAAGITSLARRLAGRPALGLHLHPREDRLLRAAAVVILLANWAYLIFRN